MSLRLNKNKIFFLNIDKKQNELNTIGDFMENDFTIVFDAKIIKEGLLKDYPSFLFSRNGKHSGISAILTETNDIIITFSYWFYNEQEEDVVKYSHYTLPKELELTNNKYVIICDDKNKKIKIYVNDIEAPTIDYVNLTKQSHKESFVWFGCGTMIGSGDNFKAVGDFEYSTFFALDIVLDRNEIEDIYNNYQEKYITLEKYIDLPTLKNNTPNLNNIKLFYDFTSHNFYKMWDLTGNGNHAQLYIENNIYF